MKYVNVDVLKKQDFQDFSDTDVFSAIDDCPEACVKKVILGKWEMNSDYPDKVICSSCNYMEDVWCADKGTDFCPNCGADMTLGKFMENDEGE